MAVQKITHLSIGDRKARGEEARDRTPPSSHTNWVPAADRPDLVGLLEEQNATREPDLVPVRAMGKTVPSRGLASRSRP